MTLRDAIYGRRSVRKFENIPVSDRDIEVLIDAAIQAPSACNLQGWKFIVVRKGDKSIFDNEIISKAPVSIFVAYRCDMVNVTGYKHKDYVQSAAAAVENLLLTAFERGLGACWICDLPDDEVMRKYFEMPSNYEVLAAVAVGYSAKEDNTKGQIVFHYDREDDFISRKRKYDVRECVYYERYVDNQRNVETDNCIREYWLKCMLLIAKPVLHNCADGTLRQSLPLCGKSQERANKYAHLEALARCILGISPWLESDCVVSQKEMVEKEKYREWARESISNAVDPSSSDYMNWDNGDQPLVDAAFLALGILQARKELWEKQNETTKSNIIDALKKTRKIAPWRSNWILFSSMIEVFFLETKGEQECIKSVIDYGISQFEQWYVGDGFYKDGDNFHFDYYESIVIHPFLIEIANRTPWIKEKPRYIYRALRYCKILLSFISNDGSYPAVGRSLCYRGGVFHVLSKIALMGYHNFGDQENIRFELNEVRTSLMSVLNRIMAGNIFDEDGWLKIGIVEEQLLLGEEYVNTGSLYMFLSMFLVLGLGPQDAFWEGDKMHHFSSRIWAGENIMADTSLEGWMR